MDSLTLNNLPPSTEALPSYIGTGGEELDGEYGALRFGTCGASVTLHGACAEGVYQDQYSTRTKPGQTRVPRR